MIRNLVYEIYPIRKSAWRWNAAQMRQYLPNFNGKKMLTIKEDDRTDRPEDVVEALGCKDAEIMVVPNDRLLQQTQNFIPVLEKLYSLKDDEATYFAYGKGVTHGKENLTNVMAWAWAQYFLTLGSIDLIDHLLKKFGTVGAFRHPAPYSRTRWHYSGAYFWFRHSAVFSQKAWKEIDADRYGVEYWLGRHLPIEESYDLADGRTNEADGSPKQLYWRKVFRRECEGWLGEIIEKEKPV